MAKKILLADDSITIQKVIELTFSDEDFDVTTVGNGRLALERLPEVRPDIVLCDIIMPEKDGYEVCEHIKSNPASSHVPVLLLTGAFEPFDQERATRAGYDGSLAKPFEPETLIAKVKDLLARAPSRAAAPPPVVPAPVPVPTVVPFARPSAGPPSPPAAPLGGGFIPDEPFPDAGEPRPSPAAPAPPLAALSEEESATLSTPPATAGAEDAASTVMFRAGDLSWSTPEQASPAARPVPPARLSFPEPKGEPEPVLVPEPPASLGAAIGEEAPVFEAVLEEDLDFGPAGFEPEPTSDEAGGETLFSPEAVPAPVPTAPTPEPPATAELPAAAVPEPATSSTLDELVSAAPPAAEPAFVEESLMQAEGATAFPAESASDRTVEVARHGAPEPAPSPMADSRDFRGPVPGDAREAVVSPVQEMPPAPVPEPAPEREPAPEPEPFAASAGARMPPPVDEVAAAAGPLEDIGLPVEEPAPPPPSHTAAFSVPVDMVEKIAQRVVAQVSEKVVREIAWEVIPDLAEALIKQEIERLKAELQKT